MKRALSMGAALALIFVTAGCFADDDAAIGVRNAGPSASDAKINLPPTPALPLLDVPRTYPDGTLSAMGLTIERDKFMGQKVRLSGIVVEKYTCDVPDQPRRGRGNDAEPTRGCLYPHFYLSDSASSSRRILITGYDSSYEDQILENTRYTVSGLYTVQASGFQASEWGIVVPDHIEGSGIQQPTEP